MEDVINVLDGHVFSDCWSEQHQCFWHQLAGTQCIVHCSSCLLPWLCSVVKVWLRGGCIIGIVVDVEGGFEVVVILGGKWFSYLDFSCYLRVKLVTCLIYIKPKLPARIPVVWWLSEFLHCVETPWFWLTKSVDEFSFLFYIVLYYILLYYL